MDNFSKFKHYKYLTPLGILSILFFIWTIIELVKILLSQKDPGFGGVIVIATGTIFIISFLLDRILSTLLKRNLNIKVQSIIIGIVFIFFIFSITIL